MRKQLLRVGVFLTFLVILGLSVLSPDAYAFSDEQKLVNEVWRVVDRAYVDDTFNGQNWWLVRQKTLRQPLSDRDSAYTAIQQMLAGLDDPFTRLLKPEQYRSLQTSTSGELTGVGLQITRDTDDGGLRVITPIEGSPAEQAGILPRDRITKINGFSTADLSLDEAAERMRGPIGSQVTLTVVRSTDAPMDVNVMRDRISLNPVYADLRTLEDEKFGYIRLSQFNANAASEVEKAIESLEGQGADAYILDLRNNPGGLLQAGIDVARLWLDDVPIVYTVNRQGIQESFDAAAHALTADPLVVLVNQGTASASEILAGALQDNERATLVGDRTFGKGLIQSLFSLSDGSGLAVTVAKYETPDHHDINRQGIQPDYTVPGDLLTREQMGTANDPQYQAALDVLTQDAVLAHAA